MRLYKKKSNQLLLLLTIISIVMAITACSPQTDTHTPKSTVEPIATQTPLPLETDFKNTDKAISVTQNENGLYDIQEGETIYTDLAIVDSAESSFGSDADTKSATIYGVLPEIETHEPLLVIMYKDTPLLFHLEPCHASFYPEVYLHDIDGDGKDEVIVYAIRAASGAGIDSVLHILQVGDNSICEIYRFPAYAYDRTSSERMPDEILNFGFASELLDGYQLRFRHLVGDYEKTVDVFDYLKGDMRCYDENGKVVGRITDIATFTCFQHIEVADVDGDGLYEIIGKQRVNIPESRSIGSAVITLKFNQITQGMSVVAVDLEINEG